MQTMKSASFNARAISAQASAILPALTAILLGLFVVGSVGFSHIGMLHNAAHDVRHANGFPCH